MGRNAVTAGPLAGVRVLDLTSIVVGPVATQFFGDYGADVVKIEPPGGDLLRQLGGKSKSGSLSPKFMNLNRNKRSLALDLKSPDARPIVQQASRNVGHRRDQHAPLGAG